MKRTCVPVLLLSLLISLSLFSFCSKSEKEGEIKVTSAEVDQTLEKIKSYEYGQSREYLTQLGDYVRYVDKSSNVFKEFEGKFIQFLESDATLAGKLFICRQLSIIGTESSIPTLSKMLLEEKTYDMARYALERISGEKVAETFRETLQKTSGIIKVGIINSLGQIQDENCVNDLGQLITDSDPMIATAAAAALGKIGNSEATTILAQTIKSAKGDLKIRVLDSYLLCADKLVASGETEEAKAIYQKLFAKDQPATIRAAALRGLIITSGEHAENVLLSAIQNESTELKGVAIGTIQKLPKSTNITKIAEQLNNLSAQTQVQLLTALGDFGDPVVRTIVEDAVTNDNEEVRIAALKSLGVLGDFSTVKLLAQTAAKTKGAESEAARESLSRLRGERVNQTIVENLSNEDPSVRTEFVRSLGNRFASETTEDVLKTTKDSDRKVRVESFKVLSVIAEPKYLPNLVDGLINVEGEPERKEAKRTVANVALKIEEENKRAESILSKLPNIEDVTVRSSLVEIMGRIGDPNCLPVLRESIQSENDQIKIAAIRAMSDWPNPEPIDDLLKVAQSATEQTQQVLALRGFIRLTDIGTDRPVEESVKNYKTAMTLATNVNEQKMVLSGLAKIQSVSAIDMASTYLENTSLQKEAEQAVIQISRRIREDHPDKVKACLTKIVESSQNKNAVNQANNILKQIQ